MILALPEIFAPDPSSREVKKIAHELGWTGRAVRVPVLAEPSARQRNCYFNVQEKVNCEGGKMQLGWAVWQHGDLFIEAEPHAVFDPGEGGSWVDCTPHIFPDRRSCREILFIPNNTGTYDFDSQEVPDNVRVPLVDDPRVLEALKLFAERTRLINTVPGIDVPLPPAVTEKMAVMEFRAAMLLSSVLAPQHTSQTVRKIGRNDPCPCGSKRKYKHCCGR